MNVSFTSCLQELVELVLTDLRMKSVSADAQQTCLEVGCGSGAISLSLLKSLPQVKVQFGLRNRPVEKADLIIN